MNKSVACPAVRFAQATVQRTRNFHLTAANPLTAQYKRRLPGSDRYRLELVLQTFNHDICRPSGIVIVCPSKFRDTYITWLVRDVIGHGMDPVISSLVLVPRALSKPRPSLELLFCLAFSVALGRHNVIEICCILYPIQKLIGWWSTTDTIRESDNCYLRKIITERHTRMLLRRCNMQTSI
jgi:hypothetical protein